ncbi:hypothetical protein [uncultured Aquimarina sp.]|uniref:hypothetical protein n=1 Tax=uncultured Aquimarina sp. TaxID=575652 RepID=UPI0026110502|nr:hypothetical protein [uncultured Aquimarina sp.]
MSWDLFAQDWGKYETLDEIPDDFKSKFIGKRSEVIKKIKMIEPMVNFSDPSWGILENEFFSIEFNMGDSEVINGFVMHVRGSELATPCIGNILETLDLKAADGSTPNFFNIEKSKDDIKKWIDYKNTILKG